MALIHALSRALLAFALIFCCGIARADCNPQFTKVNINGFGDRFNIYVWNLVVFNDYLYASTWNQVHGGEIWRYDGTAWHKIVGQGFANPQNQGIRTMAVFNGALYAGTLNLTQGGQIWRTLDGLHWSPVMQGGFGNPGNTSVRGMTVYQGQLYTGVQTNDNTPGELWRSADGLSWTPVNTDGFGYPGNSSVHTLAAFFGDTLYAGTRNTFNGTQLWRSKTGDNWQQVIGPAGKGGASGYNTPNNGVTFHLLQYQDRLYAGTGNVSNLAPLELEREPTTADPLAHGFGLYRTADGLAFEQIGDFGFGDPDNGYAWRFHEFEGHLWMGVTNTKILQKGGSVFRSADGAAWETMVGLNGKYMGYGFNNTVNWGVRSFATFRNQLYIGTAQCWMDGCTFVTGAEIWRWPGEACPAH
jgi:hypothetical protein